MADEQDAAPDSGSDSSQGGLSQTAGTNLTPPTPEQYARWLKEYRAGARSPARLARLVKASLLRIRHAVRVGWPERNLPPLRDRAAARDEVVSEAINKAATESETHAAQVVASIIVGTWEDAARAQLAAAASTTDALTKLAQRLSQAAAAATFVTYRRVPDRDAAGVIRRDGKGNPITVLKEHVSAFAVAAAASRLATAAKDHAALSKALLSSIAPGEAPGVLVGPPAVVLYMPDNNTGLGSATDSSNAADP